jgi:hypothetical protein
MHLTVRIVVFFLAFPGASWLLDGKVPIIAALIGTGTAMGVTRLVNNSRWTLF